MKYAARVSCRDGWRLNYNPLYWEPIYRPVTLAIYDTFGEAMAEALDACERSPRDCIDPGVEVRDDG